MIELARLEAILCELAPVELADKYDTPCYIRKYKDKIDKVGVCVDPTVNNVIQASKKGVQLILSHHKWLGEAAEVVEEKEMGLFYVHSAWNRAQDGNTATLARLLNLEHSSIEGEVAKGQTNMTLKELISCCQRILDVNIIPYVGDLNAVVKKVIINSGPGFSPLYQEKWQSWLEDGYDTILSSELGRYAIGYMGSRGVKLVNLGHSPMARPGMRHLAYLLQNRLKIYQCEVEFLEEVYTVSYQTGSLYHHFGEEEVASSKEEIPE